jgi:hypothetical protein
VDLTATGTHKPLPGMLKTNFALLIMVGGAVARRGGGGDGGAASRGVTTGSVTALNADAWLASALPGFCGLTEEGSEGTCHLGERGSFGGTRLNLLLRSANGTQAALACLQRCARCKRCRFVSLNRGRHPDCSWYSSCDLKRLERRPAGFLSGAAPWQIAGLATNTAPSWLSQCPRNAATCSRRALPEKIPAAGGCSTDDLAAFQRSYAIAIHQARLRQWATCNAEANRSLGATILGTSQADVTDFARYKDGQLLANLPLDARLLDRHSAHDAPCLTPACLTRQLAGRWLVFFGDSTTRMHQSALVALVATRCNARVRDFLPMLRGRGVASGAQKGQCDSDSWVTFPQDQDEAEVGSPEVGSPRPGWKRALLVSNRFLRGLDHHKLRLNVLEPHRRLFYSNWKERSAERPTHLLLEADPPEAVTHRRLKRWQPDAIIFHSCAWDLPRMNRSRLFYPHEGPERNCSAAWPASILERVVRSAHETGPPTLLARTLGASCKRRGEDLTDEQIYEGYAQGLESALRFLLAHAGATTTVFVRNCHAGSGGANAADRANHGPSEETQHQSIMRMNQIIVRVAQQLCVPVLDVHALDKAAGFYFQEGEPSDVHVPPIGALQAAFATLLAIQQLLAKTDKEPCSAR